jgi:hypothetical protein
VTEAVSLQTRTIDDLPRLKLPPSSPSANQLKAALMPKIDFRAIWDQMRAQEAFIVGEHDFADLEIREAPEVDRFHYFYDRRRRTLIKRFVLGATQRTETYCKVTLIAGDDGYEPRLDVRRDNTSGASRERAEVRLEDGEDGHLVTAAVDLSACHEEFWQLVNFLSTFPGVSPPTGGVAYVTTDANVQSLVEAMRDQDHDEFLATLRTIADGRLTETDVRLLVDRRDALEEFRLLLEDDAHMEAQKEAHPKKSVEAVWQDFFEANTWIFGYGLQLVACASLDDEKLEAITTGADAFSGQGDRVDALMSTRGYISALMFVEIKRADTDLLAGRRSDETGHTTYRSGVYVPSRELVGAVSQVSVTAHRVTRRVSDLHRTKDQHGYASGEVATVEPRRVVVAGQLTELMKEGQVNEDELRSLELYRRSVSGVDIITFDELYARAQYIVAQDLNVGRN